MLAPLRLRLQPLVLLVLLVGSGGDGHDAESPHERCRRAHDTGGGGDDPCVVKPLAFGDNSVAGGQVAGAARSLFDAGADASAGAQPEVRRQWGYDADNGPSHWAGTYPECGGRRQSPVALDTTVAAIRHNPRLHWFGWRKTPVSQVITNNGHTVTLKTTYSSQMEGPLVWLSDSDNKYRLHSVHFHWGGSEHTLNGERFAMEMHVVTYDRQFPSLEKAHRRKNGVLVLGYFFREAATGSDALQELVARHLPSVTAANSSRLADRPVRLTRLVLPMETFLQYQGSLTSPPCSQTVRWVLSKDVRSVSRRQLSLLSKLKNERGKPLVRNWRPLQPLNGRTVINVF